MIKSMILDAKQFNGLDCNISKNLRRKPISAPQENIMYKTISGDYNLRFSNYQNKNLTVESDIETSDE